MVQRIVRTDTPVWRCQFDIWSHPQYPACLHHGQHHYTIVCSSCWHTEIAWNCCYCQSLKKTKQSTTTPLQLFFSKNVCLTTIFLLFFWFKGPLRLGRYDSYASDRRVILIELRQHPVLVWKGAVQAKCHPRLQDARFLCFFFGGGVVDFFGRFGHSNLVSQKIYIYIYLCIVSI